MPLKLNSAPGYYPFTQSSPGASLSTNTSKVGQAKPGTTACNHAEQTPSRQPAKRTLPGHEHEPEQKRQKPVTGFETQPANVGSSPATQTGHISTSASPQDSAAKQSGTAVTPTGQTNAPAVVSRPPAPSSNTPNSLHRDTTSITRECEGQPTDAKQLEEMKTQIDNLQRELQEAKSQISNPKTAVLEVNGGIKSLKTDESGRTTIEVEGRNLRFKVKP